MVDSRRVAFGLRLQTDRSVSKVPDLNFLGSMIFCPAGTDRDPDRSNLGEGRNSSQQSRNYKEESGEECGVGSRISLSSDRAPAS